MTVLTRSQAISETVRINSKERLVINIRYDDQCGNGHNTFAITAEHYRGSTLDSCGCLHDEIENTMYHASEVRDYHAFAYLTDTTNGVKNKSLGLFGVDEAEAIKAKYEQLDGVIVTLNVAPTYKCKKADIEAARACAVWPDATLEQLRDKEALEARLPALMAEFRKDIESLGFTF